jgi:hypothetical protein
MQLPVIMQAIPSFAASGTFDILSTNSTHTCTYNNIVNLFNNTFDLEAIAPVNTTLSTGYVQTYVASSTGIVTLSAEL